MLERLRDANSSIFLQFTFLSGIIGFSCFCYQVTIMRMEPRVTQKTQSLTAEANPTTLSSQSCLRHPSRRSGQLRSLLQRRSSTTCCNTPHPDKLQPHLWLLTGPCPRALLSPHLPQKHPNRGPLSTSPSRPSSLSFLMTTHVRRGHSPLHTTLPTRTLTPPSSPSWSDVKEARGQRLCMDTFPPPSK